MRIRFFSVLLILGSLAVFSGCKSNLLTGEQTTIQPPPPAPSAPIVVDGVRTSYADVVEKTSPAVVRIESQIKTQAQQQQLPFNDDDFFRQFQTPRQNQRPQVERGLGSGVIVSADGTILTNNHVVEGADKITVFMSDNKTFEAKLVGSDKPSDLAVLKLEGQQNLPFLNLGNSDNVRIGDIVLAIGNPLGIGQTVTQGIISAKGRRTGLSDGSYEDFLQTDAAINRGNSGGALVNLQGELIGINSQILSPSGGNIGIGFSIPSNMAKSVMDQLIEHGKVRRGFLGVNIQNITEATAKALDLKEAKGVLVSNVKAGGSADKAGVKRGDIIIAINGDKIDDGNTLRNKVAGTLPGNPIKLTVVRNGAEQELTATLDEFQSENDKASNNGSEGERGNESENKPTGKLGLSLQPVTPQVAKQLNLDSDGEGLVVVDVDPNGASAEAGIMRGDVILEINKKTVATLDDAQKAIELSEGKPVLLLVNRKNQVIYVPVSPK
ncbi:MAG: DegQ family serine endoprotease [Pyrinomonadaceae bacterium]|nr:DegQ family serine endoprotease [Pyrinomonadaceae bacterium]